MSNINKKNIDLNSIFDKIKEKYNKSDLSRRSLSQDVLFDYSEEVIVRKIYKKTKITFIRPKNILENEKKKRPKSTSKGKERKNISLTYYKTKKYINDRNINYDKKIFSVQNKKLKYDNNNIKIISQFNDLKCKEINNNKEKSEISLKIINILENTKIKKLKKKCFDKMKYILKERNFTKIKSGNNNLKIKIHSSISCDIKDKSKQEYKNYNINKKRKINSSNNSEIDRKSSSKQNSFEDNIKIIKRIDIKPLYSSEDENNVNQNTDNGEYKSLQTSVNNSNEKKNKIYYNLTEKKQLEINNSREKNDDIHIIDILKKIKKNIINKNNIKNNSNQNLKKFKIDSKINNHFNNKFINNFIPKPIKSDYKKQLIDNNYNLINQSNIKNNKNIILLNNENYNKQNKSIYEKYSSKKHKNNETYINKNYFNRINISSKNIINTDNEYNKKIKNELDNSFENSYEKQQKSVSKNKSNIISLISPKKSEINYFTKTFKHFIPDKNNDKKIKLVQIKNKIDEINDYFNKFEKNKRDKLLIIKKNMKKSTEKENIKIISNNSNMKENINQFENKNDIEEVKIIKSSIIIKSNYNNEYNNPINQEKIIINNLKYNNQYKSTINNIEISKKEKGKSQKSQINSIQENKNKSFNEKIINSFKVPNSIKTFKINESINTYYSIDNNKDIINDIDNKLKIDNYNNKSIIKNNYIEKSGELFYSIRESIDHMNINNLNKPINNNKNNMSLSLLSLDENEKNIDIEKIDLNSNFFKYKIIDRKNRIISFLSNKYGKNGKDLKVKLSLYSYLKIIIKLIEKKDKNCIQRKEMGAKKIELINNNIRKIKKENKNNIKAISIRNYKNFIDKLINEIKINNNTGRDNNLNENNIFMNIQKFDNEIKSFKKYILFLLINKHYLKSISQKEKLITDKSKIIEKRKNNIYKFFIALKNSINSFTDTKDNKQKKEEYFMMILDILRHYKCINHRDIKIEKKWYKQNYSKNINNKALIKGEERFDHRKTRLLMALSVIILPFVYILKYMNTYQKDYSLINNQF